MVAAAGFGVFNLVFAMVVAFAGEMPHAGAHLAAALLGAYFAWRLAPPRSLESSGRLADSDLALPLAGASDRLSQLEQSIDAVAIEVERIGESQRFMTNLVAKKAPAPAGEADAAAVDPLAARPNVRRE
jgi:hypothetical protein